MIRKTFRFLLKVFLWFNIISILWVLIYAFVPVPYTLTMLTRKIQNNGAPTYYSWKSYDEISPQMPLALVASEDQKFPTHFGFDFKGMEVAYLRNQKAHIQRGGSTITQQVAKNVFLWQHKSYFRKALEAYYTVLIEIFWSKKRILEVYMNVSETGINTFGVEEGAKRYFNKSSSKLTKSEAAQIASIFPNPKKWNVGNGGKTSRIMRQMNNLGNDYLKQIE